MRTRIGASTADETAGRKRHDGGLYSRLAKVRQCTSQYSLATPIVVLYLFDSQAFHLHGPQPLDSSFYRASAEARVCIVNSISTKGIEQIDDVHRRTQHINRPRFDVNSHNRRSQALTMAKYVNN
jgi:hypothetical protein